MPRAQLTVDELETMRSRLSEAALEIYRREGLEALSFRRLAEAAGISHTLPYRYFENKEALLARLRTDAVRRFEHFVRAREPALGAPLAKIRAVAAAYIEFVRAYPSDYVLIFATHQPPPDLYPELLAARRSLFEHAVEVVQQSIDEGEILGTARELAHAVWVSLHGLMTLHVANQLVHGYEMRDLVQPLMNRILGTPAVAAPVLACAPAAERKQAEVARARRALDAA
ncbi:MAG: TetR/AcrR family transcriptional regulator [Panacagrimonas sp.]